MKHLPLIIIANSALRPAIRQHLYSAMYPLLTLDVSLAVSNASLGLESLKKSLAKSLKSSILNTIKENL